MAHASLINNYPWSSAHIQTAHEYTNPGYHALVKEFKNLTGVSVIVNTSYNVRGEAIVCMPLNAFKCFMGTELGMLIVENCMFEKNQTRFISRS